MKSSNKRRKFKIWPNMVVMVDPNNEMKQVDYGLNKAMTLRRVKWRPFCNSIWEICDPDAPEANRNTTFLPERYLYPLGIVVTRLPADMPIFNEKDLYNLKAAIRFFDNIPDGVINAYIPEDWRASKLSKKEISDRIKAIYLKIRHCKELRDI